MPIARTYQCPECNHRIDVVLSAAEWDAPPPSCEECDAREMQQHFRPPAIGGSIRSKARNITERIIAEDYNVADLKFDNRRGGVPKVRFKDESPGLKPAAWAQAQQTLQQAVELGRQQRHHRYADGPQGNALDVLQGALSSGAQPDLIANSKRKAIKVW